MPYREQIPSQHPNFTDAEKAAQAVEILERLGRGESTRAVAAAMGINRSTLYERTRLINQPLPSADVVRLIHFERLESMFEGLNERATGDSSNTDHARLRDVQLRVLARQSALLRIEATEPPAAPESEEPDVWVDGARAGADAELAEVESELRERRNGEQP